MRILSNEIRLDGKTALVTGASSGLGRQFALTLARAGARVARAARRTDRLATLADEISALDGRALPVKMDVNDIPGIRSAVEAVETELGPIDILINNSGVSAPKRAVDVEPEDYDFTFNTNTRGAFFVAQAAARSMIRHNVKGRIVNIASVAGLKVIPDLSTYCMSKAAVVQMTKALALEWARHDINVNAICPGYIRTEINDYYWETEGGKKLIAKFPRRRVGEPSDLDGLLLLLASSEARFLTGSIVSADDGLGLA